MTEIAALILILLLSPAIGLLGVTVLLMTLPAWVVGMAWCVWKAR